MPIFVAPTTHYVLQQQYVLVRYAAVPEPANQQEEGGGRRARTKHTKIKQHSSGMTYVCVAVSQRLSQVYCSLLAINGCIFLVLVLVLVHALDATKTKKMIKQSPHAQTCETYPRSVMMYLVRGMMLFRMTDDDNNFLTSAATARSTRGGAEGQEVSFVEPASYRSTCPTAASEEATATASSAPLGEEDDAAIVLGNIL